MINPETNPIILIIIVACIAVAIGILVCIVKFLMYKSMVSEHVKDMNEYRGGI
jgi:hypothetical protein